MGCSGSTHMVPATSDVSLKPTFGPANSSVPKGELVLKDLPDVVEKVIDSLKISDLKTLQEELNQVESSTLSDIKEGISSVDKNVAKHIQDASNKLSTTQGAIQGIVMHSISSSSSLKQSELELMEENSKFKIKNSPTISAADIDSLRTSSPDSEIEEALANNSDQNPPTPKPTYSELQNLVVGPVNNIIKSYVKTTAEGDKNPAVDNSDKIEENIIIITQQKDDTEWEKQADMLALSQKYNPIEMTRKFRRDNGDGERNGSGLIIKNGFKPKIQHFFEDLNEFMPLQSPLRSRISSAKSEKIFNAKEPTSEYDDCGQSMRNELFNDINRRKGKEIKFKKTPERKIKDSNLLAPTVNIRRVLSPTTNVRGVPSPSPHRVRERCAVCCNKYKQ